MSGEDSPTVIALRAAVNEALASFSDDTAIFCAERLYAEVCMLSSGRELRAHPPVYRLEQARSCGCFARAICEPGKTPGHTDCSNCRTTPRLHLTLRCHFLCEYGSLRSASFDSRFHICHCEYLTPTTHAATWRARYCAGLFPRQWRPTLLVYDVRQTVFLFAKICYKLNRYDEAEAVLTGAPRSLERTVTS